MAGHNTLEFNEASWEEAVLKSEIPVLVDFWAPWCAPCRMIAPHVEAIADELAGQAKVGKLNVDDNGGIAMRYGVRGIPTLLLFKGGQVVAQKVGGASKADLKTFVTSQL